MNNSLTTVVKNGSVRPIITASLKPPFEKPTHGAIKNRIVDYWSQRVEAFSAQRLKELTSEKHELWMNELERFIPMDKSLNILDLGTGTGFFSFLLSAAGHRATGIDLTEGMIEEAREMSKHLGIPVDFLVMDAEAPDFAPQSFDVLVTRNLTWTLPHLEAAYAAWRGLLKPGGVLINFDADYCHENKDQKIPENHAHKNIAPELKLEYERLKDDLRPGQRLRPEWDKELLLKAGFHRILADVSVYERIYRDFDEFYNPTPIFMITAYA